MREMSIRFYMGALAVDDFKGLGNFWMNMYAGPKKSTIRGSA